MERGEKMKKEVQYEVLKQEILNLDSKKANYVIAMYTITITVSIFSLEIRNEWYFLITYIILFAFERQILSIREGSIRIAAYMAVYLEEGEGWESNYKQIFEQTCVKSDQEVRYSKIVDILSGRIAVTQLGLFCSIASIGMSIYNNNITFQSIGNANFFDALCICSSICLFALIKLWCKNATKTISIRDRYIENLKKYKSEQDKSSGLNI